MFGSYEVEYGGRRYFGNVSLREFHIFDYNDILYLADVERMAAYPISRRLAELIIHVSSTSGCLVSESVILELRKLNLISDEEEVPPEIPPAGKPAGVAGGADYPVVNISLFLAQ